LIFQRFLVFNTIFQGKYWVKDVMLDETKFSMIPPAEYHGHLAVIQNNKVLAAAIVYCKIIP